MFSAGSESVVVQLSQPTSCPTILFSSAAIHTSKLLSSINVVFQASWVQTLYLSLVVGPLYYNSPSPQCLGKSLGITWSWGYCMISWRKCKQSRGLCQQRESTYCNSGPSSRRIRFTGTVLLNESRMFGHRWASL